MITMTKDLNEARFVTHAGNFHADDVFSTVLLENLYDNITLIRLTEFDSDDKHIAYDIGLGKFDHHQAGYDKKRANGIHYCGFGLLWQEYGREYLKKINVTNIEDTFNVFDYLLVNMIDAIDNGEFDIKSDFNVLTVSNLIELFRPKFNEDKNEDIAFLEAVEFAKIIFDLLIKDAISKVDSINIIREKLPTVENKLLILEDYIPYEFALFQLKNDIEFVIYPSTRGGYAAHTVPKRYKGMTPKVPFNPEWAGLRNSKLQKESGVSTARFCHNKLFIASAGELEDAIKLVRLSQRAHKINSIK